MPSRKNQKSRRASRKNRKSRQKRGGGRFTVMLDMKKSLNRQYDNLDDFDDVIAKLTQGIDTTGVRIEMDHWSSGEKQYVLHFEGDREDVNRVIRAIKGRAELKKFSMNI